MTYSEFNLPICRLLPIIRCIFLWYKHRRRALIWSERLAITCKSQFNRIVNNRNHIFNIFSFHHGNMNNIKKKNVSECFFTQFLIYNTDKRHYPTSWAATLGYCHPSSINLIIGSFRSLWISSHPLGLHWAILHHITIFIKGSRTRKCLKAIFCKWYHQ